MMQNVLHLVLWVLGTYVVWYALHLITQRLAVLGGIDG